MNYEYSIKSPCKINLSLEVHDKRDDGFHNLTSIFQLVSLEDTISVRINKTKNITVDGNFDCKLEDNLIFRAANKFLLKSGLKIGLYFTVEKIIPTGGGIGGGSGNCAAVLRLLNYIFPNLLNDNDLYEIALELGSDVPFFMTNGTALVEGRGESIKSLNTIEQYHIVLVNPGIHISTAAAFKKLKENRVFKEKKLDTAIKMCNFYNNGIKYFHNFKNSFEIALHSDYTFIDDIKEAMYAEGALFSALSGSGSTMFGIFESKIAAERVSKRMSSNSLYKIFNVKPIAKFPEVLKRTI